MIKKALIILVFLLNLFLVSAHEKDKVDLYSNLTSNALNYILIAALVIAILILYSIFKKQKSEREKFIIFIIIIVVVLFATFYSAISTVYLNIVSETKGPVHWHADFEIWDCGDEVDLIDPKGLSNRIGTSVFHEHGDNRIHAEGVIIDEEDVSLHHFFEFVGGELNQDYLRIPTNKGMIEIRDNELCDNKPGKLQVFVYKIINPQDNKNWKFTQEKVEDFENYIMSPYPNIPPGDCIIIEFDQEKQFTDKICNSYKVSIEKGELSGS